MEQQLPPENELTDEEMNALFEDVLRQRDNAQYIVDSLRSIMERAARKNAGVLLWTDPQAKSFHVSYVYRHSGDELADLKQKHIAPGGAYVRLTQHEGSWFQPTIEDALVVLATMPDDSDESQTAGARQLALFEETP